MEVDRRAFFATLGSAAVINRMPDEEKAEALEHYMTDLLDQQATAGGTNELLIRRGTGDLFGNQGACSPHKLPTPYAAVVSAATLSKSRLHCDHSNGGNHASHFFAAAISASMRRSDMGAQLAIGTVTSLSSRRTNPAAMSSSAQIARNFSAVWSSFSHLSLNSSWQSE